MRESEKGMNVGFTEQVFSLSLLRAARELYEDVVDYCVSEFEVAKITFVGKA